MILKVFGSVDKLPVIRIIFICPMLLSWTEFDMSLSFIYFYLYNPIYISDTRFHSLSLIFLVLFRSTFYALTLFDLPNFICILPMYLHPFISTPSFYPFTPPSSLHLSTFSLTFLVRLYKPPSSI